MNGQTREDLDWLRNLAADEARGDVTEVVDRLAAAFDELEAVSMWLAEHGTEFGGWDRSRRKKFIHLEYTAATVRNRLAAAREAVAE